LSLIGTSDRVAKDVPRDSKTLEAPELAAEF
jgi:hypothetical protein